MGEGDTKTKYPCKLLGLPIECACMYVTHKVCMFAVDRTYQRRNVDVQLRLGDGRTRLGREGVAIDGVIQVCFGKGNGMWSLAEYSSDQKVVSGRREIRRR